MGNTSINNRKEWERKNNRTINNKKEAKQEIIDTHIYLDNIRFLIRIKKRRPVMCKRCL